jgi:hypothetical protein
MFSPDYEKCIERLQKLTAESWWVKSTLDLIPGIKFEGE